VIAMAAFRLLYSGQESAKTPCTRCAVSCCSLAARSSSLT
jgi:hypothetical protein